MLWEMRMVHDPFVAKAAVQQPTCWGHALWSAAHTQYAQAYAGQILTDTALLSRLWWFPEAMMEGMLQIRAEALTNAHAEWARRITALPLAVRLVRWDLVDP